MATEKGIITYTATAFEQDSGQAMKNDIVRALIELITNCDDAYARAKRVGAIDIIVRRPAKKGETTEITVRDRATGLDPQGMKDNFVVLGGDKSGFAAGEEVRGLFSRGSKDTAWFGRTIFESIKNGQYSRLVLGSDGKWEFDTGAADESHYKKLGLDATENGLSATMVVSRKDTRIPELRDLVSRLAHHVQLRQVVAVQAVTITEFRDGKLIQSPKVVWEAPKSSVLFDGDIDVPGYDCQAHLTIARLEDRSDGPVNEYSVHGIEVRGRRAAYMNSAFGQSGGGLGLVHGVLTCPTIDDLIRSFGASEGEDEKNPMRLVSRSRDGLEETHPFMRALTVAVLEKLKPILADLEPKVIESGSPELKRDMGTLAQLLAEELKVDLDDEDDHGVGGNLPTEDNPIVVIPPLLKARLGSKRSLTALVYAGSVAASGLKVAVSSSACQALGSPTDLRPHATFPDTLVGQVRLMAMTLGSATVVVSAKDDPSLAGSAEVVVHDSEGEETEPTSLEWKNSAMSVTVGKTRSVRLRAPLSLAPSGELLARISLESPNIRLDDDEVTLTLIDRGWLEARVHVTGLSHTKETFKVVAEAAGEVAEGTIKTIVPNPLSGLNLEMELVDKSQGPIRGEIISGDAGLKLVIYGRHRALADRLGPLQSDGSYARDTELDTLVVIAEIMASVAGDHVLITKVTKDPSMYRDIDLIVYERTKLVDRYLRILMEGLRATRGK
jgi:hypothetical protein